MRFRFSEDQIEKLLKIAWWNWSEEKIIANIDYFYEDVEEFITRFWKSRESCALLNEGTQMAKVCYDDERAWPWSSNERNCEILASKARLVD